MGFWADWVWWLLWCLASASFGMFCRPGMGDAKGPITTMGRAAFVLVVVLAFVLTGWPGGVAVCLGGGLIGLLFPGIAIRIVSKPTPVTSPASHPSASQVVPPMTPPVAPPGLNPVLPAMGRPAILRDMVQNGISKAKVWRLIYHGKLLAFEDPENGKVTLMRPQDLEAMDMEKLGPR